MKVEMAIAARDFTASGEVAARLEAQGLDCGIVFEAAKHGKWLEMMGLITNDMLDEIGVSGTPAEVGAKLAARNGGFADRSMLTLYGETGDPEAIADLLRALRRATSHRTEVA